MRKEAVIIRTRLCIQPVSRSCRIPASTIGKPVVPVRHEVARARVTPPLPRKRRALPAGASLFDDLDEAQLDDPLVRRALLLAAEFS